MTELTLELVNKLFSYDDKTGDLIRKVTVGPRGKAGKVAGGLNSKGYVYVEIKGVSYLAHRIVFLMHHGYLPKCLDHVDNNRSNNHIENLRPATVSQNNHNADQRSNNTSGVKGVSQYGRNGKWRAVIMVDGKSHYIGGFTDKAVAETAVRKAREELHGTFVNHGV